MWNDRKWSYFHLSGEKTICAEYTGNTRKMPTKVMLLKCFFALLHLQKWYTFSKKLRLWQWLFARNIISCLLCSCWFTGLITQPEMGKPGSDCLREQTPPWTTDKRLAVKHCLFPLTGSSGFYDCSLLLSVVGSKNVASTSSPHYLPALWSKQRPLVPRRIGHLKYPMNGFGLNGSPLFETDKLL